MKPQHGRSKYIRYLAVTFAVAVICAACGGSNGTSTAKADPKTPAPAATHAGLTGANWNDHGAVKIPEPPANSGRNIKIAYFGFGIDNSFSQWMFKGLQDEAKRWGASATFVGPPSFDGQVQYQQISDLATAKQYDAILLFPNDSPSVAPAVEQAIKAGIPVVAIDFPIGPNVLSTKIQVNGVISEVTENIKENAEAMADGIITACKEHNPCKVDVLWGARTLEFDKQKPKFFAEKIKGHSNIKIVCQTDAYYTQDRGRTQAADCLQANPDLNVIASQADESTRGAEGAVTAAGRTFGLNKDDIKLIGAYGSFYGIKQVRAGKWLQTSNNHPQSMARAAVRLLLLHLAGKQVPEYVDMMSLKGEPFILDKAALQDRPDVTGEWEA